MGWHHHQRNMILYVTACDMGWIVHGYTWQISDNQTGRITWHSGNSSAISVAYQKTWEKHLEAAGEAKGVNTLTVFVHGPGW